MRKQWIGLAAIILWCLYAPPAGSLSIEGARFHALSLASVAQTYTTPDALARFLRHAFTFKTDEELFGAADYWQTPEEFFTRRAGDCEDYALFAQAILARQGVEAYVFSLFGSDGYAHTVCVFVESGSYNVIDQDRVRYYRAKTLEALAWQMYEGWMYGAIAKSVGHRGMLATLVSNPHPRPTASRWDRASNFP